MPLKIDKLFKVDEFNRAIPELAEASIWAHADSNALMSMKLDGIAIKVEWDTVGSVWKLTQLHSNGLMDLELSRKYTEDSAVFKGFDSATVKGTGTWVCYGEGINNNPHKIKGTHFAKLLPVVHDLVVEKHKTLVRRGPGVSILEFYHSIKRELEESPEIHGLVFHLEDAKLNTLAMAKVTRFDMGLPWPVPVQEPVEQKLIEIY